MNVEQFIQRNADLDVADIDPLSRRKIRQLIAFRLKMRTASLLAAPETELSPELEAQLDRDLQALRQGVPEAYVYGEMPFMEWDFYCDARALVPRPETEALVEHAAAWFRKQGREPLRILDLCTGAGIIGLSLAMLFPQSEVVITDISEEALELAKKNIARHRLQDRLKAEQGDLFHAVQSESRFDLIVGNPPYVSVDDLLQDSVLEHEPHVALFSSDNGLGHIRRILDDLPRFLADDGLAVFELSFRHRGIFAQEAERRLPGFKVAWKKDQYDVPRFLWIERRLGKE